jgi:hypothetical protein
MADITKIDTFIQRFSRPSWLATMQAHCVYTNSALERLTELNSDPIDDLTSVRGQLDVRSLPKLAV